MFPESNANPNLCKPCGYPIVSINKLNIEQCTALDPTSKIPVCKCKPDCPKCKRKLNIQEEDACKYVQPARCEPYRPPRSYLASKAKMEGNTVYRSSYKPCELLKTAQYRPPTKLSVGDCAMSFETVNNMSFQKYEHASPAAICRPCKQTMLGAGPMQDITTHKHDYVPKPFDPVETYRPCRNTMIKDQPFCGITTHASSYTPVASTRVKPYRPDSKYKSANFKMACNTTHRLSYKAHGPQEPVDKPWANKSPYEQPSLHMSGDTVYNQSYLPHTQDPRQKPFKPPATDLQGHSKIEDDTIYKRSYLPFEIHRVTPYKPKNCIKTRDAKMSGDTTNKLSYTEYKNAPPAEPFIPCRGTVSGEGPMEDITTQKRDYVLKPNAMRESCRPNPALPLSKLPMDDKTTNRLSYLPHDLEQVRVQPIKYPSELSHTSGKVDGTTIHKTSYLPWDPQVKDEMPWFPSKDYFPPDIPMNGVTIQRSSYTLPGGYIKCSKNDRDCIQCPKLEKIVENPDQCECSCDCA